VTDQEEFREALEVAIALGLNEEKVDHRPLVDADALNREWIASGRP
jgi:hypothetical protein